jgi:hypothetical protein
MFLHPHEGFADQYAQHRCKKYRIKLLHANVTPVVGKIAVSGRGGEISDISVRTRSSLLYHHHKIVARVEIKKQAAVVLNHGTGITTE